MGWTAYYQILRDRPLAEAEVVALYDFVRKTNRKPWNGEQFGLRVTRHARRDHVLATGGQKFPLSDSSDDQERLCEVLTELSKLIEDIEVRVEDDFNILVGMRMPTKRRWTGRRRASNESRTTTRLSIRRSS